MPPPIAAVLFTIGILGLLYLDRDQTARMSRALWIPAVWLFLMSSRAVSFWIMMPPDLRLGSRPEDLMEGSPTDRAVYTFLLLAGLAVLVARRERVGALLRKNVAIVLFFSFCAVSILWSDFPFVTFKHWTKAIGDLGMVLIILTEPDPLATLKRLLTRIGFLIFPLSILLIKYYPAEGRTITNSWVLEPIGVATQKNQLGLDCMVYGVVFLCMLRSVCRDRECPGRRRRLLAYGTIIAMIIWCLYTCQSMTSITGLAMAGGVMWLAGGKLRKPAAVHLLVLAALAIPIAALFFDPGGGMVEALGRDPTLTGRRVTWGLLLSMHTNPWVGTGFESFWLGPRLVGLRMQKHFVNFGINEAHNGWIEVYLNLGWAGITLVALLLLTGYRRVIAALREDRERGSLLLGLFLPTLFESLTEAAFRMMSLAWFVLLLVIIVASKAVPPEPSVQQAGQLAECEGPVPAFGSAGVHQ
jgi:O-antigen ligase